MICVEKWKILKKRGKFMHNMYVHSKLLTTRIACFVDWIGQNFISNYRVYPNALILFELLRDFQLTEHLLRITASFELLRVNWAYL